MSALDLLIPTPRLVEVDFVDVSVNPESAWWRVRRGDLTVSPLVAMLFEMRALPERLAGRRPGPVLRRLDDLRSTPEAPGFGVLVDDPPREVAVGAIGRVWEPVIPFVHAADPAAYRAFAEPGYARVAWAIRVSPRGERGARIEFELRVDATSDEAWHRFQRYFLLIGPGSHFIRHAALAGLVRELGAPDAYENDRPMEGDAFLPEALAQITKGITIAAPPEAIWPWLVQMGCRRAGFYSIDLLDNGGHPSAREIHPEWQDLAVADVLPATPDGDDGFEVLHVLPSRALVLGGLYDVAQGRQLPFGAARPERCWHVTWSFVLEPIDATSTRLLTRARAWWPPTEDLHAAWIRPVHHLMQAVQLRHLAARAEGRIARDGWYDIVDGARGAGVITLALLTSFLRGPRSHWGLTGPEAAEARLGDERIPEPRWSWTHAVDIDAPPSEVWPWIAQLGADRAGFYSYQALENLAGCRIHNAEAIHPAEAHREGDALYLHPRMAPMTVVSLAPGRHMLAAAAADPTDVALGRPWVAVTWLFALEPIGADRCRFISRYRCACSDDVATLFAMGPTLLEPVGFAMDRRMLLGVKERAESAARLRETGARTMVEPAVRPGA